MKKRILAAILLGCMVLGLVGCGNKVSNLNVEMGEEKSTENNNIDESDDAELDVSNWGIEEYTVIEKDDKEINVYIKFPELLGITEGSGEIAYQPDGSLVIFDGQYKNGVVDNGIEVDEIFPTYFEQTSKIMKAYKGFGYEEFEFEIISKKNVTVNDYTMCKYIGKHTFVGDEKTYEMAFVAYTTRLKGNDAAVYWMVLDETEDQSLGEVIESHADKMALSFHE